MIDLFEGIEMSRAERRNGQRIYDALLSISLKPDSENLGFVTVGEVESVSEYSRPTVKKYLTFLVGTGHLEHAKIAGHIDIYRSIARPS